MITSPKGIDFPIQEMQTIFTNNLWTELDSGEKCYYARVFRNTKRDIIRPEVYEEIGNKYREVLFDKNIHAMCWFDVSPETDSYNLGQITQSVGVVFTVNLTKIYPTLEHRAIEESHLAVQNLLLKRAGEFEITGIITGREAYGDFNSDMLKDTDMQPWHVFRFNCEVKYSLNC